MYNVIKLLNRNKNFISSVLMDQNDAMCGCVVVNKFVINSSYCDILIVDDTVGVDKLDYPVETVVCKDGNGHLQQVGFGFILHKIEEGFRLFYDKFRELAEKERKRTHCRGIFADIFVCDRSKPQSNAILNIFPNSKIIYCKWHLLKDISKHCGKESPLFNSCYQMLKTRRKEYENEFKKELNNLNDSKFKTTLIKDMKFFLPSIVDNYFHRNILTSNLAECSFWTLKVSCKWTNQPISTVIETLMRRSISLLVKSMNEQVNIPVVFSDRVEESIGKFALNHLISEQEKSASILLKEKCHCNNKPIKLPCCHWLAKNPSTKIVIPPEYLRFKCNLLDSTKNKQSKCLVNKINMKEEDPNIQYYIDILRKTKGSLQFQKDIVHSIIVYLKYHKNLWKRTPRRWNSNPGMIKYSKLCDFQRTRYMKNHLLNNEKCSKRKRTRISRKTILHLNNTNNSNGSNNEQLKKLRFLHSFQFHKHN